jgi:O-antigen/teichoic acid export membrane protein
VTDFERGQERSITAASRAASQGDLRSLLKLAAAVLGGRVAAAVLQGVALILLAKGLSPGKFALTAGVLGAVTFASAVADLGVTTALTRERARGASFSVQKRLLQWSSVAGLVSASLLCIALVVAQHLSNDSTYFTFLPLAVWMYFERGAETRLAIALADGQPLRAAINLAARRVPVPISVALALLSEVWSVTLAVSAGYALGAALAVGVSRNPVPPSAPADAANDISRRSLWRLIAPYWVNSMAAQSRQLDVAIVALIASAPVAALYALPARLVGPLRLVATTFGQALLAHASRQKEAQGMGPILRALLLASSILFGIVALVAPTAMSALFSDGYDDALGPLNVILVGLVFATPCSALTSFNQAAGKSAMTARANAVAALSTLALIAAGSSMGGAFGAAIGLGLGYACQSFLLWLVHRRQQDPAPQALESGATR